ncbi:hypothetical protein D3C86_1946410 [compost metagenome]
MARMPGGTGRTARASSPGAKSLLSTRASPSLSSILARRPTAASGLVRAPAGMNLVGRVSTATISGEMAPLRGMGALTISTGPWGSPALACSFCPET